MGNIVDTNGWHTVAAITYADVNKAIKARGSVPPKFSAAAADGSVSASGDFGDWRLTLGGSGPNLQMQIAITAGSIAGPFGAAGAQATLPISRCVFPVMVRATYIPHETGGSVHDLILDREVPVTVGSYIPEGGAPTDRFLADAALQELLQSWFTGNLQVFNTVFASVDLDAKYENAGHGWLKPSYKGYAVVEPTQNATLDNSIFGVLCLIDGAPPPSDLAFEISPFAIPAAANAAFILSADRFLQHMLMIAMLAEFDGISTSDPSRYLVIDNDGTRIRNKVPLILKAVQLDNGHTVTPNVDTGNFTISVQETELVIEVTDMQFEYQPGVTVHLNYSGHSALYYDVKHGILGLAVTTQSGSGSVEISSGLQIAEWVAGGLAIVGALVGGLGGAISKSLSGAAASATEGSLGEVEAVGEDAAEAEEQQISAVFGRFNGTPTQFTALAARWASIGRIGVVGAGIFGSFVGCEQIMQAFAQHDYQSMPKITDLTSAAIGKTVIWPAAVGNFRLFTAQLNGSLQFGLART